MTARRLDGVLPLDKPLGTTSSAVVQRAKRLYRARKAGHAGTLDPLASGVLLVLFGEATKFAGFGLDAAKEYVADVQLGVATETGDADGEVTGRRPVEVDEDRVERALARFRGTIEQVPPMYSALKHGGQPLYALARAGHAVQRAARAITVHALELLERDGDRLRLRILCSKGTYVRQLAADLGAELGCGAHLAALRRTAVGGFRLEQAVPLAALESASEAERAARLLPADSLLGELPRLDLDEAQAERFLLGQAIASRGPREGSACRVYGAGTLLGVGRLENGMLQPRRSIARG